MTRKKRPRAASYTGSSAAPTGRVSDRLAVGLCLGVVVAAGIAAYANSFSGVFVYDDAKHIIWNAAKRAEHPWRYAFCARRPLVELSLALNYALGSKGPPTEEAPTGQSDPWGYHLFNLAVHLLAALALFGIIRRTLLLDRFALPRRANARARRPRGSPPGGAADRGRPRTTVAESAHWFAFAVALLWVVHPLQTQSVTYLIQRGESMMGLFYLLTLYCVIRGAAASRRSRYWYGAAVVASACGMACKGVMVSAPIVVLLYDRLFLTGALRSTLRRRWGLYLGLSATWLVLITTGVAGGVLNPSHTGQATVGLALTQKKNPNERILMGEYALTEAQVLLRYLRLSVWPAGQCIDYGWPVVRRAADAVPAVLVTLALLALAGWAVWRRPALGFPAAWFFLILAPTSSFIPIRDPIYEHRMYLPLAGVLVLVVATGWSLIRRTTARRFGAPRRAGLVCAWASLIPAAALGWMTHQRNQVYHSQLALWRDAVEKQPDNARAHNNLAKRLLDKAKRDRSVLPESIRHLREAIRLKPDFINANYNLGNALSQSGRYDEAIECYRRALRVGPAYIEARIMLGNALTNKGLLSEAEQAFRLAISNAPPGANPLLVARAHFNLGNTLYRTGRIVEARGEYRKTLSIYPRYYRAWHGIGATYESTGDTDRAIEAYQRSVAIKPTHIEAMYALGNLCARTGRTRQAVEALKRVLRLQPDHKEARQVLAAVEARERGGP
ncbi:MAG: tetratricopeptide repeat protein [Phycisphaerae bacterium]